MEVAAYFIRSFCGFDRALPDLLAPLSVNPDTNPHPSPITHTDNDQPLCPGVPDGCDLSGYDILNRDGDIVEDDEYDSDDGHDDVTLPNISSDH